MKLKYFLYTDLLGCRTFMNSYNSKVYHKTMSLIFCNTNNDIFKLKLLKLDPCSKNYTYLCYSNNADCGDGNDEFIMLLLSLHYYL